MQRFFQLLEFALERLQLRRHIESLLKVLESRRGQAGQLLDAFTDILLGGQRSYYLVKLVPGQNALW